ncbi:MAG: prephenate dehydrogenase [Planctomycetaceae bacterium]|nr:prephenate dehydrogenase [Planctomycetaceae bacterium]
MSQSTGSAASLFETIAIVGVGLIGGSLAAAIKRRKLARQVIGVGRDRSRLDEARVRGLIDESETDVTVAAARADLIVFCTPVDRIAAGVREAAPHCRSGTIVTDVGSVKGPICDELATGMHGAGFPSGVEFVGSHPLAGSEKQGFEFADAELFVWRVCVLTPQEGTSQPTLERLRKFWEAVGSTIVEMSPDAHDKAVAETSHLPHVVAAALASTLQHQNAMLAASGFRDTTRVAGGDPDLWTAILLANAESIVASSEKFSESLRALQQALRSRDAVQVKALLTAAKQQRELIAVDSGPSNQ